MVLTSTMIGEDQSKELNQMMIPYNEFLRQIAKRKNCLLADLNAEMQAKLKTIPDVPGKPKIHVSLPKFKVESEYKLNDTLKTMGMPTAFTPGKADFTGLNESYGKELFISAVLHKGFVEVGEEGTEAAAATAVISELNSIGPSFDGTHPFLYLIRDNKTGVILFLGRMMDPTEK